MATVLPPSVAPKRVKYVVLFDALYVNTYPSDGNVYVLLDEFYDDKSTHALKLLGSSS